MSTDDIDYDDGLVHSHGWSSSTSPGQGARSEHAPQDDGHDDGLVHSHHWATMA